MATVQTKRFPARVVLTVTTGRLLTEPKGPDDNGIGDLYKILNWMTSDNLFTHQLGRAMKECKPWLLRWFPELEKAGSEASLKRFDALRTSSPNTVQSAITVWLDDLVKKHRLKPVYDVLKIPADDHERKDAFDELVQMQGTDENIEIVLLSRPDEEESED